MLVLFRSVLSLFNLVFRGFLIKTFWAWFLMSKFTNLPSLNVLGAIGLIYFVNALSPYSWRSLTLRELKDHMETSEDEKLYGIPVKLFFQICTTLAIAACWVAGWVVHHFM